MGRVGRVSEGGRGKGGGGEEGEWREVLYYVSPDGKTVRVRTLDSHFPVSERLNGFPDISEESFE